MKKKKPPYEIINFSEASGFNCTQCRVRVSSSRHKGGRRRRLRRRRGRYGLSQKTRVYSPTRAIKRTRSTRARTHARTHARPPK